MCILRWRKKKVCVFVSEGNQSCQRTQQPGSRYCLGHDPDPKDYQQFMEGLFAELNDSNQSSLNAEGWIFPPDEAGMIKLNGQPFSKKINLKKAQFRGHVYFNSSEFPGGVDFTGAHFHGSADFTATKFPEVEGEIDSSTTFDDAYFEQEVIFNGTEFYENASFVNCHFKGELKMDAATKFSSDAFFNGTQLEGKATLSGAQFEGRAEFKGTLLKNHSKFIGTRFKEQVLFESTNFVELVEFSKAQFYRLASFPSAVFQKRALFEDTKFLSGDVKFEYTNFNGSSSFKKCEFHGESYFTQTNFVKEVDFTKVMFEQPVNFEGTIFNKVSFVETEFKQKVQFVGTQFNGWAQFSKPKFLSETIFEGVQFTQITALDNATFGQNATFNVQVNERNRLAIRNSDVSKVKFSLSNIENIEFQDATWIESRFVYRWKIADEPLAGTVIRTTDEIKKLQNARRLYRQLRLNHDKVGEYAIAGRFYCSESEMSYLLLPPFLRWIHPRGLYKWASKYGESILQAIVVLLVLIFIFAFFYYESSAKRQIWFKETPKTLATLNAATPNVTTPRDMVTLSWWESVWLSMQASKPLADLGLSPKTILYWVVLAQGFIVPTQVGLFLLAIRRRFRRGD